MVACATLSVWPPRVASQYSSVIVSAHHYQQATVVCHSGLRPLDVPFTAKDRLHELVCKHATQRASEFEHMARLIAVLHQFLDGRSMSSHWSLIDIECRAQDWRFHWRSPSGQACHTPCRHAVQRYAHRTVQDFPVAGRVVQSIKDLPHPLSLRVEFQCLAPSPGDHGLGAWWPVRIGGSAERKRRMRPSSRKICARRCQHRVFGVGR